MYLFRLLESPVKYDLCMAYDRDTIRRIYVVSKLKILL